MGTAEDAAPGRSVAVGKCDASCWVFLLSHGEFVFADSIVDCCSGGGVVTGYTSLQQCFIVYVSILCRLASTVACFAWGTPDTGK